MKLIVERMQTILPTINKRPQSLKRLVRATRENFCELYFVPLSFDGYFVPAHLSPSGNPQIFINSRLPESAQVAALAHELTHLCCHARTERVLFARRRGWDFDDKQTLLTIDKQEFEANAMGALALFPVSSVVRCHEQLNLFEETFQPSSGVIEAWRMRLHLRQYGI